MRIWSILLGTTLALSLTGPALAGPAGGIAGRGFSSARTGVDVHRWGPQWRGRWFAGWHAPGGWAAYRRPVIGYVLPSYWISPAYRVGNFGAYGLPAPIQGYGWSRYYDDAVMVDRDGRVRDYRERVDWDRGAALPPPGAYDDDVTAPDGPPPPHHQGDMADRDSRDGHGADFDAPPPSHAYEGRWTGQWRDDQGRAVNGEYVGRFEGEVHGPGVDYDAPPYASAPAPVVHHDGPGQPIVTTTQAPGHYANGYYYPGATTTTIVVQPTIRPAGPMRRKS